MTSSAKVNPEAHDAYLRGRFYWNKDAREDLEGAREYFEQALEKDPRYAPAYAGLADYYNVLPLYTNARPDDVFPKAMEAVAKALELDSSLAEAHGTQAYILTYYDRDWAAAQREFQEALALNPNDATVHHRYSRYLSSLGRVEEALSEIERARLLDPNALVINANVGLIYYFGRQYDRAIEELQKVLHDHPDFSTAHWGLGLAYEQKGNYDQALPEFQKAAEHRGPNALASLGHIYGLNGQEKEAKEILSELSTRAGQENISEYQPAVVHIGLRETEAAMESLQRAYREHSTLFELRENGSTVGPPARQPTVPGSATAQELPTIGTWSAKKTTKTASASRRHTIILSAKLTNNSFASCVIMETASPPDVRKIFDLPQGLNSQLGLCPNRERSPTNKP